MIEVVSEGSMTSISRGSSIAPNNLGDSIFVIMGTPKKEYYLNEKIPLTVKLLINSVSVKNFDYPKFDHIGFNVDEFSKPEHYQKVISGIKYDIVSFKTFIYPTRVGALSIGPAKLTCNVLFKRAGTRKRTLGSFGSIFDDDFFDGFFDSYDIRAITLESEGLALNILELPIEGKPKDFSNAVGVFEFDVSASPGEIDVGDPVTVRMKIGGEGNLKSAVFPKFKEDKKFKYYEQQINDDNGGKVIEQVVIPTTDRVKEIPALSFSYFDVENRTYKRSTKGPFPIKVNKREDGDRIKTIGFDKARSTNRENELLGKDISFIKDVPGGFRKKGAVLYESVVFWMIFLALFTLWLALFIVYKINHKIRTDVKFAKKLQAPGRAKKGLKRAVLLIDKDDHRLYYYELFRTFKEYFSNRFQMSVNSMSVSSIEELSCVKGVDEGIKEKIKTVFDECEMVSYASIKPNKDRMIKIYNNVEEIIDYFERKVR